MSNCVEPFDTVHQHDDQTWWFFDESGSCEDNGPFDTKEAAEKSLDKYVDDILLWRNNV